MYKETIRPAWVEINLKNLDYNIKNIIAKVGSEKEIIGVIKADGYGHGAIEVAQVLIRNGVETLAIATLQEAIDLRKSGIKERIIVLGLTPNFYVDVLIKYNLTPVINSYENALAIGKAASEEGTCISGFIAVDTGMGRIGYLPDDKLAIEEIKKITSIEGFTVLGLFSHFATADAEDKSFANLQEAKYKDFLKKLLEAKVEIPIKTFANSAAIMELPSAYFDAVRPGIVLYGCYPSSEVKKGNLHIKPVMSVKGNIVRLKKVPVGFSVGYGRKFISERESLIATVPLGYADGYPRLFSKEAEVIINGVMAPVAGNICMDQFMVDVTDVPSVKEGDEVIIMGSDGTNTILADHIALATGTINYEIVCGFGQRLPRIYV